LRRLRWNASISRKTLRKPALRMGATRWPSAAETIYFPSGVERVTKLASSFNCKGSIRIPRSPARWSELMPLWEISQHPICGSQFRIGVATPIELVRNAKTRMGLNAREIRRAAECSRLPRLAVRDLVSTATMVGNPRRNARKRIPPATRRRALELFAASPQGCTEALEQPASPTNGYCRHLMEPAGTDITGSVAVVGPNGLWQPGLRQTGPCQRQCLSAMPRAATAPNAKKTQPKIK
jgi:hypothetical protein